MDPAHYQAEAARCRELAARSSDPDAVKRWLQLAADYDQLARTLDAQRDMHAQHKQQQQVQGRTDALKDKE